MRHQTADDRIKRRPILAIVRHARNCLFDAQFRLDELGFHCRALDDLSANAGALVSAWEGRKSPVKNELPAGFADAAREYRRSRGLSY